MFLIVSGHSVHAESNQNISGNLVGSNISLEQNDVVTTAVNVTVTKYSGNTSEVVYTGPMS